MKNIALIIIVIFINFAFVTASLNWEREELYLLGSRHVNKISIRNSSLEARAYSDCQIVGYHLCPDNSVCCRIDEACIPDGASYSCSGGCDATSVDCGNGYCCRSGQVCVVDSSTSNGIACEPQKKSSGSTISPTVANSLMIIIVLVSLNLV
ncbi:5538_t:CDS:1 [Ambispora gerdemannii]|uniref:5538_t:CDS:1 n=1 Tax=Ambispora gerdemannii TaxID=144530 RepID=A0A9N9G8K3_9GLOM|nr:5538_t:CDS:1 [Ambispora gerdemannii]